MTDAPATMWRHLPNALTVLRMGLVVPLAWLIRETRYDEAVIVAAVAGLTDALDGFLAKRCGWQSWLGGVLDPIADKLMLVACFVNPSEHRHDDRAKSASVSVANGCYRCHGCGAHGGAYDAAV